MNPIFSKFFKFVIKRRTEDLAFQRNIIIKKYNVSLLLDVGAHFGETVREIRSNGYSGKIVSIEPTPKSFNVLSKIKDKNMQAFNIGLGESSGFLKLNEFKESYMNSFLKVNENSSFEMNQLSESLLVELKTLDSFIFENSLESEVIFLKIDVQGYEMNVLKGLEKYKDRVIALQVEISINSIYIGASIFLELQNWLNENNFRIISIVTERFDEIQTQAYDVDVLCLRNY